GLAGDDRPTWALVPLYTAASTAPTVRTLARRVGVIKRPGWFRRALRLLGAVFAGLGLLLVLFSVTPLVSWWAGILAGPWEDPSGDVLIVLGGSLLENRVIGQNSYWRSAYALLAWRDGTFRRVVVSGGGPTGSSIA